MTRVVEIRPAACSTALVDTFVRVLLAVSALLTLACWGSLWRGEDRVASKVAWSFLSAFPLLGPLLYAGVHDPPPVQPEVDRAPGSGWDGPTPNHGVMPGHHP